LIDPLITQHFRLSEFTDSDMAARLGIDNRPPPDVLATLRNVLIPGMQAVRNILGKPVFVTSGYRSPALNAAVHGAQGSQHLTGHACDFRSPEFGPVIEVCAKLVGQMARLKFDQLIYEGSWCHISFAARPRNQVLTAHFDAGRVTYTAGLVA
jgi:hypothetical protein